MEEATDKKDRCGPTGSEGRHFRREVMKIGDNSDSDGWCLTEKSGPIVIGYGDDHVGLPVDPKLAASGLASAPSG
jgi:hypothetical protein